MPILDAAAGKLEPGRGEQASTPDRAADRRREGWALFPIEVPLSALADTLVRGGHLDHWDADDRSRIHDALQAAILEWVGI